MKMFCIAGFFSTLQRCLRAKRNVLIRFYLLNNNYFLNFKDRKNLFSMKSQINP